MTSTQIAVLAVLALFNFVVLAALVALINLDLRTLLAYYTLAMFVLTIIGWFRITRYGGSLKRGVPIWKEDLSEDMARALRRVLSDIHNDKGFIQVHDKIMLVHARHSFYNTAWPYVAYIDLRVPNPKIEYRTGLAGLL